MAAAEFNRSTRKVKEIPEIPLRMDPSTPQAKSVIGFQWNSEAGRGHKLGGSPDWSQGDETPECPPCFQKMTFYGQLDCIGDDIALGDCGRIFVFVCMDCFETKSVIQCS
ncbi:MAG: hypothetical protein SynsKO_44040 [Synoicihabitans sp.]